MRVLVDAICKICGGVFCCSECRHKHEVKYHAIVDQKPFIKITPKYNKSCGKGDVASEKTPCDKASFVCPICERRPLILKPELQNEFLLHLELYHLPLRCQKCLKMYTTLTDLKEFSKCFCQSPLSLTSNQSCFTIEATEVPVTKGALPLCFVSQTSPQNFTESHMTPISIINMRWKAKNKLQQEGFISDSVSSIKNLSSISNISSERLSEMASAVIGKVVRCSSTPVQLEMIFAKPKEQTFNATGGHMSSIQYNSGCESDTSPAFSQPNSQALEPVNRYKKVAGSRPRMTAITPLRQVMSKSIQKAFAEHGLPARSINTLQRKNMFDSTSSPEVDAESSPAQSALDLRLSPAIRRSQSGSAEPIKNKIFNQNESCELPYIRREILLSAQKLTTESIVITRTEHLSSISSTSSAENSNFGMHSLQSHPGSTNSSYQTASCNSTGTSLFKSCRSVEIIATTTKEIQQYHSFDKENVKNTAVPPLTPRSRIPGSIIHKKIIKFETPKVELCDSQELRSSPHDEFFTPSSTPMPSNARIECSETETGQRKLLAKKNLIGKFSPLRRSAFKECAHSTALSRVENMTSNSFDDSHDVENDEVFLQEPEKRSRKVDSDKNENKTQTHFGFWSIMTSVMRLPSFKGKNSKKNSENETYSSADANSIIKRCASVAGSMVRSKSLVDDNELSSLKRKRTYTTDNQSTSSYLAELNDLEATADLNISSKRFRIRGRRPIDRMRLNS